MRRKSIYFAIAFVSGACVMAIEILSVHIISPFYGTSLYVWASAIGVTLGALALGYFVGGAIADKFPRPSTLSIVFLVAAATTAAMPFLSRPAFTISEPLGLRFGSLTACLMLLFVPLGCLGMVSPTLIRLSTERSDEIGKISGTVYAVSTLGGIFSTFAVAFFMVTSIGVQMSCLIFAGLLALCGIVCLQLAPLAGLMIVAIALLGAFPKKPPTVKDWAILYSSDGMLGHLKVVEDDTFRRLLVNNVGQTMIGKSNGRSYWRYTHALSASVSGLPSGAKVLLLGLGGGSIASEVARQGKSLTTVELNPEIERVARAFFNLDGRVRVIIDDGRHYVRTTDEKYDAILIDAFSGEREPAHVISVEAFREMANVLNPDGFIAMNFFTISPEKSLYGAHTLVRTIEEAGFIPQTFTTGPFEEGWDMIVIAPLKLMLAPQMLGPSAAQCCKDAYQILMMNPYLPDVAHADVATDDRNVFLHANIAFHESWRTTALDTFPREIIFYR